MPRWIGKRGRRRAAHRPLNTHKLPKERDCIRPFDITAAAKEDKEQRAKEIGDG